MLGAIEAYDASEQDERPRSDHFSRKDLRYLFLGVVLLVVLMWPLYAILKGNSERSICANNFQAISTALGLYMTDNDDRFPPPFATGVGSEPRTDAKGRPFTWCSLLDGYMTSRATFVCPSAADDEKVHAQAGRSSGTLDTTYGMYPPYAGVYRETIPNISQIALIVETSNAGSQGSFDPVRFLGPEGQPQKDDGFAVGFDDSNDMPTPNSRAVTRLAFRNTADGKFGAEAGARHRDKIFVLNGDLRLRVITPEQAQLKRLKNGEIVGLWAVPPTLRR